MNLTIGEHEATPSHTHKQHAQTTRFNEKHTMGNLIKTKHENTNTQKCNSSGNSNNNNTQRPKTKAGYHRAVISDYRIYS